MGIENISGRTNLNSVSNRTPRPSSSAGAPVSPQNTDKIDTQIADKIKIALSSPNSEPVRNPKIAELQQAIASGSYKIDPERIASKMLQFERALPKNEE